MFKCKISSKILNNKQIQEVKKLKRIAKHEYQEKMKTKNWKSYSNSFNTLCRNSEKPKDNN